MRQVSDRLTLSSGRTAAFEAPTRKRVAWASGFGAFARRVANLPLFRRAGALFTAFAEAGVRPYPPDVRRRLKILNVFALLVAILTFAYAVQQTVTDYRTNAPAIAINIFLVAVMLLAPLAHRLNEVAGGLLIVSVEYVALFGLTAFFGRNGGTPLHYFIAAAAPFVIFGLERLWLVLTVVMLGLALHIVAWFSFPPGSAMATLGAAELDPVYTQAAVTTFALIAACVYYAFSLTERAKAETEALLRNILPERIVERLKAKPNEPIADAFDEASVLFADISGFVPLARRLGPSRTVELLNRIVTQFDALAARRGVEKIKTIGDAYMAAAGVPEPIADHAHRLARLAIDMHATIARLRAEEGLGLEIRIGLASGPVMAGVIGVQKFNYDVWGDAVNLAARLESLGRPGRIHVCPTCRARLGDAFLFESLGEMDIKGVGRQETWLLAGDQQTERVVAASLSGNGG